MRKIDIFRENGRINIDNAVNFGIVKKGSPNLEGAREKFWCESKDGEFLYKKIVQSSYEDYAEIIASEIANMIELPCAEYDFAISNDQYGVISFDFVGEDEELISGKEILEQVNQIHILPIRDVCSKYKEFINIIQVDNSISKKEILIKLIELYNDSILGSKFLDTYLNSINLDNLTEQQIEFLIVTINDYFKELSILYEYDFEDWNRKRQVYVSNNLMDIWSLLDNYCKINGFHMTENAPIMLDLVKLFLYDIILNQGDRHISNWGVIRNVLTNEIRLAPIYDNSKICKLYEEQNVIKQKATSINSFNNKQMNEKKREATRDAINNQLNGKLSSKLMVDFDDNDQRNNRVEMLKKLFKISSEEVSDFARYILSKLKSDNIIELFENIEKKYCIEIPNEVKVVTLKVVELNLEQINIILGTEEKSYGV